MGLWPAVMPVPVQWCAPCGPGGASHPWAWPTLAGRCIIRVLPGSVRRIPPSILTCTLGENGALPVPSPCYYFTASEHTRVVQRVKVAVTTSHAVLGTHPSNMELQP